MKLDKNFFKIILIPSLGYFVDSYDLVIFNAVRTQSLESLGYYGKDLMSLSISIANMQRYGLILGGIFWGVLGDKIGRQKVLFWSIILFSLATFANAFAASANTYLILRFIAGFGLAAEFGLALTYITEHLPIQMRTYAVSITAFLGLLGGTLASLMPKFFSWQDSYMIGGIMGALLLISRLPFLYSRVQFTESQLYLKTKQMQNIQRGNLIQLMRSKKLVIKLFSALSLSLPIACISSIWVYFSPEIARELCSKEAVHASDCLFYSFIGCALGDLLSGPLSHFLKSRKKLIAIGILFFTILSFIPYFLFEAKYFLFYIWNFFLGIASGYWVILITASGEQFGTNLRATATSLITNLARASGILLTNGVQLLLHSHNLFKSSLYVSIFCIALTSMLWRYFPETFNKSIDFAEN